MDSLESASTTDVSIWRPGPVQYLLSRRPFPSREGTNPILNYLGSGSSPGLLVALIHGGVNFRCEYKTRLRKPMRLLEHTFLGLGTGEFYFEKATFAPGEPVYLYFKLVNDGPDTIEIFASDPEQPFCSRIRSRSCAIPPLRLNVRPSRTPVA